MDKKLFFVFLLFFLVIPISYGDVTVVRNMPEKIEVGEMIYVTINIEFMEEITDFDIVEMVPHGWEMVSWNIENFEEDFVEFEKEDSLEFYYENRTSFHWSFKGDISEKRVIINYELLAKEIGEKEFVSVWAHPRGFDRQKNILEVVDVGALRTEVIVFPGILVPSLNQVRENITSIFVLLAIILFLIAIFYVSKKINVKEYLRRLKQKKDKIKRIEKGDDPVQDIRAFLKYGVQKGHRIIELVKALKSEGVETDIIEKLIEKEELKDSDEKEVKVFPEDKIINEIKEYLDKLSKEEKEKIHKELNKK